MDALDYALQAHAATASAPTIDPLDAALEAHAAGKLATPKAPLEKVPPSYWETFKNSIPKGAAGFADAIPNALVNVANLGIAGYGTAKHALTGSTDLPALIPSDALSGYSKLGHAAGLIDDSKDPVEATGRVIDMTGQVLAGGGLNPMALSRSLARRSVAPAVRGVVAGTASGVGAGAGAELTRNTNTGNESVDNLIKALGTVGGGMAPGGFIASRTTAANRAAAATKGITADQWAAAKELAKTAENAGSPVTGYEALQAATGQNPKMQTQQRIAEQSDAAGGGLTQMMQRRPGANEAVFNNAADSVASYNSQPDVLAGLLKNAATGAIKTARDQGNAKAAPFYAQSSNDPSVRIPPSDWNTIANDPAIAYALEQTRNNPLLGVQGAREGSLQWLDAAKKFLDSRANSEGMRGNNFEAKQAGDAATRITSLVDPIVPAYAQARAIVADNMRNNVEPMEASQVGKLSRSDNFGQQAETLLPNKPLDVTPAVVSRTAGTINGQDPNIMRQFVAQYLRGQYNEATQQNIAGPNVFGGSKFAAQVAGNPMQEENLNAALIGAGADPQQMATALQIFRAQGMKPAVNSATTANAAEAGAMGGGIGGYIKHPIANTFGLIDSWRNGGAAKDLAKALSSGGQSVGDIEDLARVNGAYDPVQQQLLANLLAATRATNGSNQANP